MREVCGINLFVDFLTHGMCAEWSDPEICLMNVQACVFPQSEQHRFQAKKKKEKEKTFSLKPRATTHTRTQDFDIKYASG